MRITFKRLEAAHVFAAMAEDMSETHRDDGDAFSAEQLSVLSQHVWDDLVDLGLELDETGVDFAKLVRENLEDGGDPEWRAGDCVIGTMEQPE